VLEPRKERLSVDLGLNSRFQQMPYPRPAVPVPRTEPAWQAQVGQWS
jgi:hypothetical protein